MRISKTRVAYHQLGKPNFGALSFTVHRSHFLYGSFLNVLISFVIPWGVFTRYVLNSASSWPEPAAILLSIVLTFFGAAAGYRVGLHMRVSFVRDHLPPLLQRLADLLAELLLEHVNLRL